MYGSKMQIRRIEMGIRTHISTYISKRARTLAHTYFVGLKNVSSHLKLLSTVMVHPSCNSVRVILCSLFVVTTFLSFTRTCECVDKTYS